VREDRKCGDRPGRYSLGRRVLGGGARGDLQRKLRLGDPGRDQLHDQLQDAGRGKGGGGAEETAGTGPRDLHGTQCPPAAGGGSGPGDGDERSETPLYEGYTGTARHRLLELSVFSFE